MAIRIVLELLAEAFGYGVRFHHNPCPHITVRLPNVDWGAWIAAMETGDGVLIKDQFNTLEEAQEWVIQRHLDAL